MRARKTIEAPARSDPGRRPDEGPTTRIDLRCAACGYGVAAGVVPAACPMCQAAAWVPAPWRPFTRSIPLGLDDSPA
jgi:hypothetical protein